MAMTHALVLPAGWIISTRLMPAWKIDADHLLELEAAGRTDESRIRWRYRLSRRRRTIFAASDICSAVGAVLTTDELIRTARTVLCFLTAREGDTDAEYFDSYTRTQVAWRDRYAEELSIYAMDGWCGYCGGDHLSPGCLSR
ncbi:hypothetical protein [Planotetraspora kaengkrachanensis]|uniref:Uncharacterized protein n=1 Tax=Planotetraspora kaengkrachanensis TaxID=575193 RepID=A0A8J3M0T1_9ACTN|nr:hypothetical protein [Planotetraspora kaengkrachanensis]GIG79978.1 hypothetical protein Pka01_31050 [Planotetraspora kaengkrachanensis]